MKFLFKKYSDRIMLVVMVALVFGSSFFGIMPLYEKLLDIRIDTQRKEIIREIQQERVEQYSKKGNDIFIIEQGKQYVDDFLAEDQLVSLISEIELIADNADVTVSFDVLSPKQVISFKKERRKKKDNSDKKEKEELPEGRYFMMTLLGEFSHIVTFLYRLEKYGTYIFVDNISMHVYDYPKQSNNNIGSIHVVHGNQNIKKDSDNLNKKDSELEHVEMRSLMHIPIQDNKN